MAKILKILKKNTGAWIEIVFLMYLSIQAQTDKTNAEPLPGRVPNSAKNPTHEKPEATAETAT